MSDRRRLLSEDQLARILSSQEPTELRSYIARVSADQAFHYGTTVPALGLSRQLPNGLWIPAAATIGAAPIDHMQTFITFEEVTGTRSSWDELLDLVSRYPRNGLLKALAYALRRIEAGGGQAKDMEEAQVAVMADPYAQRLQVHLAQGHPLFTRQAAMALAKLAIVYGGETEQASAPLSAVIGLLFAGLHDHLGADQSLRDDPSEPRLGDLPGRLSMAIVANQWFNRGFDAASYLTLYERRWRNEERATTQRVVAQFKDVMGFEIEDQTAVALAMWASASTAGTIVFECDYFSNLGLPSTTLDAILSLLSVDIDTAKESIAPTEVDGGTFEWNYDTFERFPILRLWDGRLLLLEPAYLLRRCLGWAPIYDLNALRSQHDLAASTEAYALDVLEAMYNRGLQRRFFGEPELLALADVGEKSADAAIDFGDAFVVVEITARRPLREVVHGASVDRLSEQIDLVVEEIEQIAASARRLQNRRQELTGVASSGPVRIYPVVLMTEGFPTNPITLTEIRRRVADRRLMAGMPVSEVEVIDLVELEMIESVTESGGRTLPNLIDAKSESGFRSDSVRNFMVSTADLSPARPGRLQTDFSAPLDRVARRLMGA